MRSLNISVCSCNRCFSQGIHELTEIARDFRKSLVLDETCFMAIKLSINTIKMYVLENDICALISRIWFIQSREESSMFLVRNLNFCFY